MASQFGNLPPGAAPYGPRPSSPRGLYRTFGMPERLLRIHFPADKNDNPKTSNPWYWWIDRVQPNYFSFLAPPHWGPGWVRQKTFTVIRILVIDTQVPVPTPFVGFSSIEEAIRGGNAETFGRFDERDQKFWDLINSNSGKNPGQPKDKPKFNVVKGQIQSRDGTNINARIKSAVTRFKDNFDALANGYNQLAAGVSPSNGFHYPGQTSQFNIPLPDGPPTTVSRFNQQLSSFVSGPPYGPSPAYIGPISGTAFFNINTFTTQAQAFTISIGQLDDKKWDMSHFPPTQANDALGGRASAKTKDYSGYSTTPFPLHGLEIL